MYSVRVLLPQTCYQGLCCNLHVAVAGELQKFLLLNRCRMLAMFITVTTFNYSELMFP